MGAIALLALGIGVLATSWGAWVGGAVGRNKWLKDQEARKRQVEKTAVDQHALDKLYDTQVGARVDANILAGAQQSQRYEATIGMGQQSLAQALDLAQMARDVDMQRLRGTLETGQADISQAQRMNRMQVNQQYLRTEEEGRYATGAMAAQGAASGIRGTGSAALVQGAAERFIDADLGQIEATLAEHDVQYGLQRESLETDVVGAMRGVQSQYEGNVVQAKLSHEQAASAATLMYEQTVESILGRDIEQEDLLEGRIDWTDYTGEDVELARDQYDIATRAYEDEIDWLASGIGEGYSEVVGAGMLEGASTGLSVASSVIPLI